MNTIQPVTVYRSALQVQIFNQTEGLVVGQNYMLPWAAADSICITFSNSSDVSLLVSVVLF